MHLIIRSRVALANGAWAVARGASSEGRESQGGAGKGETEPGEKSLACEPAHVFCFCSLRHPAFSGNSLSLVAAIWGHHVPSSLKEGRVGEKLVGTVIKLRVS